MVTSKPNMTYVYISDVECVPNFKVIFFSYGNFTKQTKRFCPLLLSFCKSGGTRCPCFVFTSISTSYLTSFKPNLSWTTQQPALLQICLRFEISQMSEQLFYKDNQPSFKNFHRNKWSRIHGSTTYISDGLWTPMKSIVFSVFYHPILWSLDSPY